MADFVIRRPEKEVISLRIPVEVLQRIDKKAAEANISRNELINQMITYVLENWQE